MAKNESKKTDALIAEFEIPAAVLRSRGIYAFNAAVRNAKKAYLRAKRDVIAGDQTLVLSVGTRE